jgi:hypothetical protein
MNLLVNYANRRFRSLQQRNAKSALAVGGIDQVCSFAPQDIDASFASRNRHILDQERGNGYWLWKPYFIRHVLQTLRPDDYLFYCDAGAHFLAPIDPLVAVMQRDDQDVLVFELSLPEGDWTKRDAFVLLDCDRPEFVQSRQRLASFHLWRNSERARAIVDEWLQAAQDERLSTDTPNQCGLPNHPGFEEHRHDQSLLSLVTKKHGLTAYRNPAQGRNLREYPNSPYGRLINHTRRSGASPLRRLARQVEHAVKAWRARWQTKAA